MKTHMEMLESIAAELTENLSLLEFIYRNNPDMGEVDNCLACLIRSMQKSNDQVYRYIDSSK